METYVNTIQFGQFSLLHQTQVFGGMVGETHTVESLFIVKGSEIVGGFPQVESITYDQAIQMAVDFENDQEDMDCYLWECFNSNKGKPMIERYESYNQFGVKVFFGNAIDYLKNEFFCMSPEGIEIRQRNEEADAIRRVI